jgi:aspartate/methionine/tyrosine aminotransferase
MAHLKMMRNKGVERLSQIPGVWCPIPQATPFLFPNISSFGMTSKEMTDYLKRKAKVIVMDGSEFGPPGEGFVRINFATAPSVMEEAIGRMEEVTALRK